MADTLGDLVEREASDCKLIGALAHELMQIIVIANDA
jgi:hypothetical protein